MNIEVGKKYKLKNDKSYFCIPLQRRVRFDGDVIVEVSHYFKDSGVLFFGNLLSLDNRFITKDEIEFVENDVICECRDEELNPNHHISFCEMIFEV